MHTDASELFTSLLPRAPLSLQQFLQSALKLSDLQSLYAEARKLNDGSISRAVLKLLNIKMAIDDRDLERIPKTGPVIVVANHPFGLLDGLLLHALLTDVRPDFRILTNSIITGLHELQDHVIPVDVFGGQEQARTNLRAIRAAVDWLQEGHCTATFPSGEVSHWNARENRVADPAWSEFPARCAAMARVPVIPVYFHGGNSLAFQIGGVLHPRLRTLRLPAELLNKQGRTVKVNVGTLVRPEELHGAGGSRDATSYLRARTYVLRHRETPSERALRASSISSPASIAVAGGVSQRNLLARELADLGQRGRILESETYDVYSIAGNSTPALLREIGRLREVTFREAGEGTGRALDLDRFDTYYTHLVLWNKIDHALAGAYRLAWTSDVLRERGPAGLYTSTLFRFAPAFFSRLGPAVELGRSFICAEYQKSFAPLLLLWQGIARSIALRPEAPVLFGPVSISSDYSEASRQMIVRFLKDRRYRTDLAPLAKPRHPFRSRLTREAELLHLAQNLRDVEDLAAPIRDVDSQPGVPVLLRQYLKMGGRVAGFNVDPKFSNALDGLLVVDLRDASDKLLAKYMGAETAAAFRERVRFPQSA